MGEEEEEEEDLGLATARVGGRFAAAITAITAITAKVLAHHAAVTGPETAIPRGPSCGRAEFAGGTTLCRDGRVDVGSPTSDLQYAIVRVIERTRPQPLQEERLGA